MSQYDNNLTGMLFRNDKGDNEKRPDYKGSCEVNGVQYWISGWVREAGPNSKRAGEKFISMKLEPKEQQAQPQRAAVQQQPATVANMDDDIPF